MSKSTPKTIHDRFPGLSSEVITRIEDGLTKNYQSAAPDISADSWQRLEHILANYREEAQFLRGFLKKGQARLLNSIATRSRKLLQDLATAKRDGLAGLLEESVAPIHLDEFEVTLQSIAEQFLIEPRDEVFLKDVSRLNLYMNFESWWQHSTGQKVDIQEGTSENPHPTPFMFVANEVFNLPGMPPPTGASYKTLKDHRRDVRNHREKLHKLGAALRHLSAPDPNGE